MIQSIGQSVPSEDSRMVAFENLCRSRGLRVTPQRLAVYRELIETHEHPSAEWVHRRLREKYPNISLDTVNRTLLTLARIGAAFIVEGGGDAKRFDAGIEPHQHFRCVACRKVIDFHYEAFDKIETPDAISHLKVLRKTVYFEGLCDECITNNRSEEPISQNGDEQ
jgi:Fur family transcriptional regulator, peroxide stress response regulator